jgi:hypothetical protein
MWELWETVQHSINGPGGFRFFIQPSIAIFLGIRDGMQDAKTGKIHVAPWLLLPHGKRDTRFTNALETILIPLLMGTVLDLVYVYLILRKINPMLSIFVGVMLLGLPYIVSHDLSRTIAIHRKKRAADRVRQR